VGQFEFPQPRFSIPPVASYVPMAIGRSYLIVPKHDGSIPPKASCAKCRQEFVTPVALLSDKVAAEKYLLDMFDLHPCGKVAE
jgi:hypothetical protein